MDCSKCNLKQGSTGNDVKTLETYLFNKKNKKGIRYYSGKIDGIFGPILKASVKAWQGDNGLVKDGWFGPKSCNKSGLNTPTPSPVVIPDAIKPYLQPTKNCQSNNATIIARSKQIVGNSTNILTNATNIFNYVRTYTNYPTGKDYYNNTKYGAYTVLTQFPLSNCCDMAHAIIALARAAGIPARYRHVVGKFKSGKYGHVLAQLWVNGKWYDCDATDNDNTFGKITNWTSPQEKGFYKELPF